MKTIKASIQCFGISAYKAEELAVKLDCNKETILRYIRNGKIRAQKIGRSYYISEDNYRAFINAETTGKNAKK